MGVENTHGTETAGRVGAAGPLPVTLLGNGGRL